MSTCSACDLQSTDPSLTALTPEQMGGGKKKKTRKAAPKKANKKKSGGSFLGELGQLAIPLGLIAAKEGIEYLNKGKSSSSSKKKTTAAAGGKKKATATRRRGVFGGQPDGSLAMDSAAPYPSSVMSGLAATPVTNATAPATISTAASTDDSGSTHLGGGGAQMGGAQRSALIAQEFKKMASEITEFLQKRNAAAAKKAKKPAARPKGKKGGAGC